MIANALLGSASVDPYGWRAVLGDASDHLEGPRHIRDPLSANIVSVIPSNAKNQFACTFSCNSPC